MNSEFSVETKLVAQLYLHVLAVPAHATTYLFAHKYTRTLGDLHIPINIISDRDHPSSSASVAAAALRECDP
jgi:heme oxygenase